MDEWEPRNVSAPEGYSAARNGNRPTGAVPNVPVPHTAGSDSTGSSARAATATQLSTPAGRGSALPGRRTDAQPIPSNFPPVVYLPCAEAVDDPAKAAVEMRQTRDGRVALLAYSALDRLHDRCGVDQPWILVQTSDLTQLQTAQPFQLLLLDVEIPRDKRKVRR